MTTITRTLAFDAGHRVPYHGSKCAKPHGHRYQVEATVVGPVVHDRSARHGMVLDFGTLKLALERVLSAFDHRFLVWSHDPTCIALVALYGEDGVAVLQVVPTAEELAGLIAERLRAQPELVRDPQARLVRVRVFETPNCWADWEA